MTEAAKYLRSLDVGANVGSGAAVVVQTGPTLVGRNCACCCDQPTIPPDCPACKGAGGFPTFAAVVTPTQSADRGAQTRAARDVLAERWRQLQEEGWSPQHDDSHCLGELGLAAALYALPYDARISGELLIEQGHHIHLDMALEIACGWRLKPDADPRRRLVKAGALILAEIERRDRAAATLVAIVGSAEGSAPVAV